MKKKAVFILMTLFLLGCQAKDPREKTVWDYMDGDDANEEEWCHAVESLHQDLIKHGYMKEHSCYELDCYHNHKGTTADIERINKLQNDE